jgi:hypothetical protein
MGSVIEFHELVLIPEPMYGDIVFGGEKAFTLNHILFEMSFELFSIGKLQFPLTLFCIFYEIT